MGISKSQANALAESFLDDLGSNKDGFVPRETLPQLFLLAGEFIEDCQTNLNNSNSNASGKLSSSLAISNPQETGSTVSVDVLMEEHGLYINGGVRGTKSGQGQFKFKYPKPSKKMVAALVAGANRAKRSTRNVNRNKTTSVNEKKNARVSDIQKAWGAATNIKLYGIKATGFLDKAAKTTEDKVADRFGKAFEIDILNSLPNTL